MSSPTLQRLARLSLVPGICTALALVAGAYANPGDTEKKATSTSVAADAADTGNQLSGANPSLAKVIGEALGSRLPSPRVDGYRSPILAGGQCNNDCGAGDVPEGEVCAGDHYVDTTNGGCNSDPDIFGDAFCDVIICGTSSNFDTTGDGQSNSRDTDWYLISAAELAAADTDNNGVVQFQATLTSEFDGVVFFIAFDPDCDSLAFPGTTGFSGADCAGGESAVATLILDEHPAGVVVFVSTGESDGTPIFEGFECTTGLNDYTLLIQCDEPLIDCAPGSGPCGEPNGSPGCEDPECCKAVCAIDPACCFDPWSQNCANIAIEIGCAGLPCPVSSCEDGVCTLTQSQNSFIDAGNQVACGNDTGTTPNFWARCYNLVEEGVPMGENLTINSVTFGVAQATVDGINIDVTLYIDCNGCPPDKPLIDALVLATQSLQVNIADVGTMITVNFPAGTVVPAGVDLIVEIGSVDDGSIAPGFSFRAMSNDVGQCAPSYIRTDGSCGLGGWTDLAEVGDGFPDAHLLQSISATVGGVVTVDCLEACSEDAGPCGEPNGSPGCEDPACCAAVCAIDPACCFEPWSPNCVEIAINNVGCVPEPCEDPGDTEGVSVPAGDDFDSYKDGFLLTGVNGWSGWEDSPGAVANVTSDQFRSAPHSIEIDAGDDPVQQYLGAFCEGQYVFTVYQYIPSNMVGLSFFIMLNTYNNVNNTGRNWSVQVNFDNSTGLVHDDGSGAEMPIINDAWVEIRLDIDLDADFYSFFYGGNLLYSGIWSDHISGDGARIIDTVDLFANGATPVYYDDLSLVPAGGEPCPADLVVDGVVGVKDLLFLLGTWGPCPKKGDCPADLVVDGVVGVKDLLFLLGAWGPCP
ncbi:MAG: hypothetical protein IIB53_09280 [Planctomycetes bacterium]|nr:hypothetical protein [Planctomycetota bacterium]